MGSVRSPTETDIDEAIGARIRARREEMGFPQRHVAELVGVTFQQLQKYESGANRVSAAYLVKIAAALRVDPADLLPGGSGKQTSRAPKAALEDGMALQLQSAYARVKSVKERRLILDLTKRLGAAANAGAAQKKRRT